MSRHCFITILAGLSLITAVGCSSEDPVIEIVPEPKTEAGRSKPKTRKRHTPKPPVVRPKRIPVMAAKPPRGGRQVVDVAEVPSPRKANVITALQRARTLFDNGRSSSDDFRANLQAVAADLPELRISTSPNRVNWNLAVINQTGIQFDAFRFRSPFKRSADMWWAIVTPDSVGRWYILPAQGKMRGFRSLSSIRNFRAPGVKLPAKNLTVIQKLEGGRIEPGQDYIVWFARNRDDLAEFHIALNLAPTGSTAPTINKRDIAERIGLRIPGYSGWLPFQWFRAHARVIAFSPVKQLMAVSFQRGVRILTPFRGQPLRDLKSGRSRATGLSFASKTGELAVVNRYSNIVTIWDRSLRKQIGTYIGQGKRLHAAALSPDGKILVVFDGVDKQPRGRGGSLVFWNVAERKELSRTHLPRTLIDAIIFSRDGKTVVAGGGVVNGIRGRRLQTQGVMTFWDVKRMWKVSHRFTDNWIDSLDTSPDARFLAAGSSQSGMSIWNIDERRMLRSIPTRSPVTDVRWSLDSQLIYIGETSGHISQFWFLDQKIISRRKIKGGIPVSIGALPRGRAYTFYTEKGLLSRIHYSPIWMEAVLSRRRRVRMQAYFANSQSMSMIPVRAGRFYMGAPTTSPYAHASEQPQRRLTIERPFYLARHEVFRVSFQRFVKETGYKTDAEKAGSRQTWRNPGFKQTGYEPVVCVSWNDTQAYCRWLSKKEGRPFRLPSEAEWEYACKAGDDREWTGGTQDDVWKYGNILDLSRGTRQNAAENAAPWNDGFPHTAPANYYSANGYILCDMHGNAAEWCQDWFDANHYRKARGVDGPKNGTKRVIRGGSYRLPAVDCRTTWRVGIAPTSWRNDVGFRVACDMKPDEIAKTNVPIPEDPLAGANFLRRRGRFQEAIKRYRALLKTQEPQAPLPAAPTLLVARRLADTYSAAGDYKSAIALYRRCFEASEVDIKPVHTLNPSDLGRLARTYVLKGDFDVAEKLLLDALRKRKMRFGADHAVTANAHYWLGWFYAYLGDTPAAQPHYEQAGKSFLKEFGFRSPLVDRLRVLTAATYVDKLEFDKALPLMEKSKTAHRMFFRRPGPWLPVSMVRLAVLYDRIGRKDEAAEMFGNAFTLLTKLKADYHPDSVEANRIYAEWLISQKRFSESERLLKFTVGIAEDSLGPRHPDIALMQSRLGACYQAAGQYPDAELAHLKSLALMQRWLGKDHPRLAKYHTTLGGLYVAMKKWGKAKAALKAGRELLAGHGRRDRDSWKTAFNLATVLRQTKRSSEAVAEYDRGVRELRTMLTRGVPILPDRIKYSFARIPDRAINRPLSAALHDRDDQPLVDKSVEWVANMKGMVNDVLSERERMLRDADDPQTEKLAKELIAVRGEIASLSTGELYWRSRGPTRGKIRRLEERARQLSSKLGSKLQQRGQSRRWTTLGQIRKSISEQTVCVEIKKVKLTDTTGKTAEQFHYVAWVIPSQTGEPVRIVDLGEVEAIDQAIADWHRALKNAPELIATDGEPTATKHLNKIAERLSAMTLKPLGAMLDKSKRLIISPDSATWLIPWASLRRNGGYLIESHEVSTVISTRLLATANSKRKPAVPVIVADPDYNHGIGGAFGGRFARLPGTAIEAEAIKGSLAKLTGAKPRVLLAGNATEQEVKGIKRPRVLVLSTHGYFQARRDNSDPLTQCGLAFAGANVFRDKIPDKSGNDGILTGLEAVSLDLRGTDLVVLSACESGLGAIRQSEGVIGLRHAFRLAGAKTVAATLWNIQDRETADLVSAFFSQLAAGSTKSLALQQAQIAAIKKRKQKHKAAHPIYWAAFVLTGRVD